MLAPIGDLRIENNIDKRFLGGELDDRRLVPNSSTRPCTRCLTDPKKTRRPPADATRRTISRLYSAYASAPVRSVSRSSEYSALSLNLNKCSIAAAQPAGRNVFNNPVQQPVSDCPMLSFFRIGGGHVHRIRARLEGGRQPSSRYTARCPDRRRRRSGPVLHSSQPAQDAPPVAPVPSRLLPSRHRSPDRRGQG